MMFSKKRVRSNMRKLMKCMNYVLKKAESTTARAAIYYDIYQLLGGNAWSDIANHCEHEYRVSKKHPTGRCSLCGTIRKGFKPEPTKPSSDGRSVG